ncbi:MAG: hypothetical protein ACI94Y_003105 [Maribacter sp.]|jgi:hypothetical protein
MRILIILITLFITSSITAQVKLSIKVTGLKSSTPAYVTVFSKKDKKTEQFNKGSVSLELIRYTQYIVVIYQKGRKPYVISLDTEKASRQVNVNTNLQSGKATTKDYSPVLHYSNKSGRYSGRQFDLDKVRNKPSFGVRMQEANEDIKRYFSTGEMPYIDNKRDGFKDDSSMRKTEHMIGQEIYKLLGKKRALELDLQRLNEKGYKNVYPDADMNSKKDACQANLNILRREKQYYNISYKLAKSELEKTEVMMNKRIKKGEIYAEQELRKSRSKLAFAKQESEASDLNYANKKTDCWELGLRADMSKTVNNAEKQILEIEINNIRLYQRKQNARRLYTLHNKMAMDVTERDRLVELAKAQKFVSDHAKARVSISQNKIIKLKIKDGGRGVNASKIISARKELTKNEELAFQAEMGYLEHMWNLRSSADFDGDFVEELYLRQNKLLELKKFPERTNPEDFIEGYDPDGSFMEQALALFDSFVKISKKSDTRGGIEVMTFKDDFYEIVMDTNGNKTYFKNDKPVTALTYRFETIKKYGEFLKNIHIVPEKRSKFLDFFKKRTDL